MLEPLQRFQINVVRRSRSLRYTSTVCGWHDCRYADRPKVLAGLSKNFFSTQLSPELQAWFGKMCIEANAHATIESVKALRDEDLRGDLAKIQVPSLILHGVKDQICPFSFAEEMQEGIANSKLVRFENSGHGLFYPLNLLPPGEIFLKLHHFLCMHIKVWILIFHCITRVDYGQILP